MNTKNIIFSTFIGFTILIVSVFLGSEIATENYSSVLIGLLIAFVVIYVTFLYKKAFIILFLLSFSGITVALPFGDIRCVHIAILLFVVTFAYDFLMHPRLSLKINEYKKGFLFYLIATCIIGFMYLYQIVDPVNPFEFSSKQTLKALLETLAPFLVLCAWCFKNDATVFKLRSTRQLYLVLGGILLCHIGFRLYLISIGALDEGPDADVSLSDYSVFGPLSISSYVLRGIGPLGALIGAFSFFHWSETKPGTQNKRSMQVISLSLFILGLFGALLSAGRGSLIMVILGVIVAMIYYRRFILFFICVASFFLLVAVLNVFSSVVQDKLPDAVSRTLTLFIIEDDSAASMSVDSSSNWRKELGEMAYDEWVSDPDIFIRGRGVYTYTDFDILSIQVYGGYEAKMYTSLKTANAHTNFLSLALKFGLIGIVLYYGLYLIILSASLKFIKSQRHTLHPLYLVSFTLLVIMFPLSFITGGGMSFPLLLLLLSSRFKIQQDEAIAELA